MGVSINGGSPIFLVYFIENAMKIDDLGLPSGKLTVCYWKSSSLIGKSTINGKFSIANC
jgi:hypothetical protein